ncbi:hypothetical protein [Verrucomicrobium spinosum]|uniref:hypothetical protein n=1 Tax=Verrucomicrobium spinosum TaxID=2736 RepID=UPI00210A0F54|nr:hypothetical protein [Verrucomicrobium spinosum]
MPAARDTPPDFAPLVARVRDDRDEAAARTMVELLYPAVFVLCVGICRVASLRRISHRRCS